MGMHHFLVSTEGNETFWYSYTCKYRENWGREEKSFALAWDGCPDEHVGRQADIEPRIAMHHSMRQLMASNRGRTYTGCWELPETKHPKVVALGEIIGLSLMTAPKEVCFPSSVFSHSRNWLPRVHTRIDTYEIIKSLYESRGIIPSQVSEWLKFSLGMTISFFWVVTFKRQDIQEAARELLLITL